MSHAEPSFSCAHVCCVAIEYVSISLPLFYCSVSIYEPNSNAISQIGPISIPHFFFSYTVKLSSWRINVFNNVIILLAMFSIIYLLIRLKSSMSEVLPIYFNFIVVATVTFVFVVIINLVGDANADDLTAKRILKVRDLGYYVQIRSWSILKR